MDDRIDLTEDRVFRDERPLQSLFGNQPTSNLFKKIQQSVIDDTDHYKKIDISWNGKLEIVSIRKDLLHLIGSHICDCCGRKHFGAYGLCDKCDDEISIPINRILDTDITVTGFITSDLDLL